MRPKIATFESKNGNEETRKVSKTFPETAKINKTTTRKTKSWKPKIGGNYNQKAKKRKAILFPKTSKKNGDSSEAYRSCF